VAEWDLDGDELKARHPGIEPHVVHPELGVEQVEDELDLPSDEKLGLRWLTLSAEEQQQRCRDMLRALLQEARVDGAEARYRAFRWDDEAPPDVLPLDDAAIERLLDWRPDDGWIHVERDERRWCEFDSDADERPLRAGIVWIEPWQRGELEERLSRAWWEPAQERERAAAGRPLPAPRDGGRVSRETRAYIRHGWDRVVAPVVIALAAWLGGTRLPLAELLGALVTVVVALVVLWTVDSRLRRWYERS
jgi:hypothetical protein